MRAGDRGRGRGRGRLAVQTRALPKDQIPEVDQKALSELGFDLQSPTPIDAGLYGTIFLGKCNEAAHCKPSPSDATEETDKRSRPEVSVAGLPCVIKFCAKEDWPDQHLAEAMRLEELRHRNIVQVYGTLNVIYDNTPNDIKSRRYFVMEYINGGTLQQRLSLFNPNFTESEGLNAILDIIAGLVYLHGEGWEHKDLHQGNVMLHVDHNDKVVFKIVDFGKTRDLRPETSNSDIRWLGLHITDILAKSDFQRQGIKFKLRQLADDIANGQYMYMNEIQNQVMRIIPDNVDTTTSSSESPHVSISVGLLGALYEAHHSGGTQEEQTADSAEG